MTLFQLRLTRRVQRYPIAPKLALAMLLMGFPFLLLSLNASIPVMALVILIFVIGEMLWIPASQAIVAGLAPPTYAAPTWARSRAQPAGFALGPFIGLQIRAASGTRRCGASSRGRRSSGRGSAWWRPATRSKGRTASPSSPQTASAA